MITRCPSCKSVNIRYSSIHGTEVSVRHVFLSAYRCRDCRRRFWSIKKSGYYLAGMGVMAIIAAIVGANMLERFDERPGEAQRRTTTTEGFEGQIVLADDGSADRDTRTAGRFADVAKRAHDNDPAAEYQLAQMYLKGEGGAVNEEEARVLLERAAEHGNVEAQFAFSIILREGRGVIQDFARAAKLTQMAAESGHSDAQYELGLLYRAGKGVPTDTVKAYTWFNLAAARGVKGAAQARDQVLRILTPQEVLAGQAEARRLSASVPKLLVKAD
jgi:TPR repeat protein